MKDNLLFKTEGETAKKNVVEFTKKTTKRKNSGSVTSTHSKRNNFEPALKEEISESLRDEVELEKRTQEFYSKIQPSVCQIIQSIEQCKSLTNEAKNHYSYYVKDLLELTISYLEENATGLEKIRYKEHMEKLFTTLAQVLVYYSLFITPEEYLQFIISIKPRIFKKILDHLD